jgi:23S rRNA (cytosine1962-C5)-methyltransferase
MTQISLARLTSLRRLELSDLDALVSLDAQCFAEPWPRAQLEDELAHTAAVVVGAYSEGKLVGAICSRLVVDEVWVFRIMTLPELRRQKIAHALVERVEAFAQQLFKPSDLWLEVSVHNTGAIAFYEREGFAQVSVRKDYYPDGDALVMKRAHVPWRLDYELVDFGAGFKLERFGAHKLMRPDAAATGPLRTYLGEWEHDSVWDRVGKDGAWDRELSPWVISRGPMLLELRQSQSKNIGVFPEQESNWDWLASTLWRHKRPLKVLNLFAYTGAASIICAQNMAQVTHVDSARSAVRWASDNAQRSGGSALSIRWIVDDAQSFLNKEIRRGQRYDGIILDPPPMGHGQGNRFEFRKDALDLIRSCKELLADEPAFFLLNAYAMNLTPEALGRLVGPVIALPLQVGELGIKEALGDRRLSCSVYARYRA